jgi:2',3'-cyclic-nucleotide 2'-phosphodiesterase (5'-nucleotidase family)
VDLTFDLDSRRLVDRRVFTLLMDDRFAADPVVMELARPDLARSEEQLARRVATVTRDLGGKGRNSRLVQLLCESFAAAVARQGMPVDGVFHGSFATGTLPAGPVTVADCWQILPYENRLVVAELTGSEIAAVLAEDGKDEKSDRTLWPFDLVYDKSGTPTRIALDGEPVAADRRLTIAFNSYDAQSGGRRLMKLREILGQPGAKRRMTPVDSRTALIEHLLDRGEIG